MKNSTRSKLAALLVFGVLGPVPKALTALAQEISSAAPVPAKVDAEETMVRSDYVIGVEDVLGVLVWREPEMSGDVTVRPDGMITLPLVGDLKAEGLTPGELAQKIEAGAAEYFTEPNVTVVVRAIMSRKAFITGEINAPGAYALGGPLTVVQLISLAGGLTEFAKESEISIMRVAEDGRTRVIRFNYKWIRQGKRLEHNILLKPGDTVVVP